jgi:hypothetical protein
MSVLNKTFHLRKACFQDRAWNGLLQYVQVLKFNTLRFAYRITSRLLFSKQIRVEMIFIQQHFCSEEGRLKTETGTVPQNFRSC